MFFYVLHADEDGTIGEAILLTYLTFVILPILQTSIGILGKWLAIGKVQSGEYPLYGFYYYRWWLAERFIQLAVPSIAGAVETPALPAIMWLLGARVGSHCHIGLITIGAAFDLVSIGDNVVMGKDTVLATSCVQRGRLILASVSIGSHVHVGCKAVMEGNSVIEDGGELGSLSMLPSVAVVPAGQRWIGSPARFDSYPADVGNMRATQPSEVRIVLLALATLFTSIFIIPILAFAPQIPTILLFKLITIAGLSGWAQSMILSLPASFIYLFLVFTELLVLRWIVLGRVRERKFGIATFYFYCRWFVDRLMDVSLVIFHPVYATLYAVHFLRATGVKIGHMAEVSTAHGILFELTEIGVECFVADTVIIGDTDLRGNVIIWEKTTLKSRSFRR